MTADDERRSRLLSVKLRALVREHGALADPDTATALPFAPGAALIAPDSVWVLVDGEARDSLGAVLAWALPKNLPVNIVAESGTGILARRAALFDTDVTVWHADARTLLPAIAEPHQSAPDPSPAHLDFVPLIRAAGADALVESGTVVGEVMGLEMCRVVDDPVSGSPRLEVGMGAHDREAFAMVHGDLPTEDALRQVIDAVAPHRMPGAAPHPFNQFAAERLHRWRATNDPSIVGLSALSPADPPVPRSNVKDPVPCAAVGDAADGSRAVAVFVHGVVLDAVPWACDAADMHGADHIVLAARRRDVVPSLERMAARSRRTVRFAFIGE